MSEGKKDRKMWPERVVNRVYREQDGVCGNPACSNPLDKGFHRHHEDGDRSNAEQDNLQLLCMECHHATFGERNILTAHRDVEREVAGFLREMVTKGLDGKLSGANMERLIQSFSQILKISRNEKALDKGTEYPSAEIKLDLSRNIQEQMLEEYMRGYRDGIKAVIIQVRSEAEA